MIPVKKETNYLMDWNNPKDRINYFRNLRKFLQEIDLAACDHEYCETGEDCGFRAQDILDIFKRWNVYFIDVDEIPRVNLDEPKE